MIPCEFHQEKSGTGQEWVPTLQGTSLASTRFVIYRHHVSSIIDEEVHQTWRHHQPQKRSTSQNVSEPSSSRVTHGALSKYLSASWDRWATRCMHTCRCKHNCCFYLRLIFCACVCRYACVYIYVCYIYIYMYVY